MKGILTSVFTVASAITLASAGLYQSAFAEDFNQTVTKSGTSDPYTAVDISPDAEDYTADATINITWDNSESLSYWQGYAYGVTNSGSIKTLNGSISIRDFTADASKLYQVNLYALSNSKDASIESISGVTISAINSVEPTSRTNAYGIYNNGTITAIEANTTITVSAFDSAIGIANYSNIGNISNTTISVTSTNNTATGISLSGSVNQRVSISGSVTANSGLASYALLSAKQDITWNFDGDTTLTAKGGISNYAIYADSGEDEGSCNITLTSVTTDDGSAANATVSMTGDIYTAESLTIDSGNYVLAGDSTTITASRMSISSGASLTLNDAMTFNLGSGETVMNYGTINADASYLSSSSISNKEGSVFGITGGTIKTSLATTGVTTLQINEGAEVSSNANYIDTDLINKGTLNLTDGTLSAGITMAEGSKLKLTDVSLDANSSISVNSGDSASIDATNLTLSTSDISMSGSALTINTFDVAGDLTVSVGGTFTVNLDMSDAQLAEFEQILKDYASTTLNFTGISEQSITDFELVISNDASEIVYNYSCTGDMLNSDAGSGVNITISSADIIPEPSTATLSLLALAGLCFRRRRKAA